MFVCTTTFLAKSKQPINNSTVIIMLIHVTLKFNKLYGYINFRNAEYKKDERFFFPLVVLRAFRMLMYIVNL